MPTFLSDVSLSRDGDALTEAVTKNYIDTADGLKAPLASPTFTGVPAAPTATLGTNTTQLATTAFVLANAAGSGLPLTGGTLTGGLTITAPSGDLALNVSRAGNASYIYIDAVDTGAERFSGLNLRRRGLTRWTIAKNSAVESGSDTGSDFTIYKYADDGSTALVAYAINRASLQSIFYGPVETKASAAAAAGLRLKPGVAPTTPLDGELWVTTAGFYGRVNGATVGPFGAGGGGGASTGLVLTAGAGLTGGGDLTTNRTFDVVSATTDMTVGADSITINSAPKWTTARTVTLSGDVTSSAVTVDGSANWTIPTAIAAGSIIDADVNSAAAIATSKISGLDTALTARLLKSGDAMTAGDLTLFRDPTAAAHASTKKYVDDHTPAVVMTVPVASYLTSPYLCGGTSVAGAWGATTATAITRGLGYPYIVETTMTFNNWWTDVRTAATDAGSTVNAALYSCDPVTGWPKTLILDLGSRAATATGGLDVAFTAQVLTPGQYWILCRFKSATTAGTNPQMLGNAMTGVYTTVMSSGNTNIIMAIDCTAMGANWAADITSYLVWNLTTLTTLPRVGLKRSA